MYKKKRVLHVQTYRFYFFLLSKPMIAFMTFSLPSPLLKRGQKPKGNLPDYKKAFYKINPRGASLKIAT